MLFTGGTIGAYCSLVIFTHLIYFIPGTFLEWQRIYVIPGSPSSKSYGKQTSVGVGVGVHSGPTTTVVDSGAMNKS